MALHYPKSFLVDPDLKVQSDKGLQLQSAQKLLDWLINPVNFHFVQQKICLSDNVL